MAIPLELRAFVTSQGLEVFNQIQGGIAGVSAEARGAASAGLRDLGNQLSTLLKPGLGKELRVSLGSVVSSMKNMAMDAAPMTSSSLAELAMSLDKVRASFLQSIPEYEGLISKGLAYRAIISQLTPAQQAFAKVLELSTTDIRQHAVAMRQAEKDAAALQRGQERLAVSTKFIGKAAHLSVFTGMNVLSSATQGVMMGMGALQGSVTSVGFGLVFLRYSIAPVVLAVAGLVTAIGGTLKAISFVGPAFEKLIVRPMNRIKAAVVEAMGYFSGAVWVRIIAPSLQILADLAERFKEVALQTWLSAEVQKAWGELLGMVRGTFENLNRTIKEHGDILKWVVRTGFIIAINVLKGLVYLINVAITVLPQMAYFLEGCRKCTQECLGFSWGW